MCDQHVDPTTHTESTLSDIISLLFKVFVQLHEFGDFHWGDLLVWPPKIITIIAVFTFRVLSVWWQKHYMLASALYRELRKAVMLVMSVSLCSLALGKWRLSKYWRIRWNWVSCFSNCVQFVSCDTWTQASYLFRTFLDVTIPQQWWSSSFRPSAVGWVSMWPVPLCCTSGQTRPLLMTRLYSVFFQQLNWIFIVGAGPGFENINILFTLLWTV